MENKNNEALVALLGSNFSDYKNILFANGVDFAFANSYETAVRASILEYFLGGFKCSGTVEKKLLEMKNPLEYLYKVYMSTDTALTNGVGKMLESIGTSDTNKSVNSGSQEDILEVLDDDTEYNVDNVQEDLETKVIECYDNYREKTLKMTRKSVYFYSEESYTKELILDCLDCFDISDKLAKHLLEMEDPIDFLYDALSNVDNEVSGMREDIYYLLIHMDEELNKEQK